MITSRPTGGAARLAAGGLALALAAGAAAAAGETAATIGNQQPGARSANAGVYTGSQARRGRQTFEAVCTTCHDAARFTGDEFIGHWQRQPLQALFAAVNTMPEDNPGSLTPAQYADILAWFLELNGYPTGETELPGSAEALKAIVLDPRKPVDVDSRRP